jgi:hypothetical protein
VKKRRGREERQRHRRKGEKKEQKKVGTKKEAEAKWHGRNRGARAAKKEGRRKGKKETKDKKEAGAKQRWQGGNRGGRGETEEAGMANKGIIKGIRSGECFPAPPKMEGDTVIKKTFSSSISSCRHPCFWFLPE